MKGKNDMSEMNLYKRMSAITNEITRVAKNLSVGEGTGSYKAVGEADVLAAVRPAEEKFGVYSYPLEREIVESAVLSTVGYNGKEKKMQFLRVRTVYRFVNIDKPEEHIDITTYGDGVDTQDKAPGKAMTYGDKYALLKAYKIITGEDPDQTKSEDMARKDEKPEYTPMATDKQIAFIKKLAVTPEQQEMVKGRVKAWNQLTMSEARHIIEELKYGDKGQTA